MTSLFKSTENTVAEFGVLDDLVGDISAATSSLSDKLERLSRQHQLAQSSQFLIQCYLGFFNNGECRDLNALWEGSSADRRQCANVVRQLQALCRRIEVGDKNQSNYLRAQDEVDKFAERLEKDLLESFDNAYRAADLSVMKESADLLRDFNGGASVVQVFVNQHDFFIVQEKLVDRSRIEDNEMWARLADNNADEQEFDNVVQELIDEIRTVVVQETDIIRKVFGDPVMVLRVFLQRIFAQRIQQQLEAYLIAAENISLLAYVRTLHICYSKVGSLVKSLKDLFGSVELDSDGELSALLDQSFGDLFVPYIENGQYFDSEKKSLNEVTAGILTKFTEAHFQRKLAREQSLLGRITSSLDTSSKTTSGGDASSDNKSGSEKGRRIGQFMRAVRLERTNSSGKRGDSPNLEAGNGATSNSSDAMVEEFDERDLELKMSFMQQILKAFAEAVNRHLEMSATSDLAQDAETLLSMLIELAGKNFIDVGLEDALSQSTQDAKNEISLDYLSVIHRASIVLGLMSTFAKTVLFSMFGGGGPNSIQKKMVATLNGYVSRTEEKVNTIVQNTIDLVLLRLAHVLGRQKKKDYLPRDDAVSAETAVCQEIKQFLSSLYTVAHDALDGHNRDSFLLEVGTFFRDALMDHIKKFSISAAGGRVLARDIQGYQEVIDSWSLSELSEAFTIVHSIGNLYTAEPQVLLSLLKESHLTSLKPYVIREYLSKRVDYHTSGINKLLTSGLKTSSTTTARTISPYPLMM